MIDGEFPPAFPLDLAAKDAGLALEAAEAAGLRLGALAAVREQMRARERRRATATRTWRRRSTPAGRLMSRALIIVDYQNDFARPDGALSVPAARRSPTRINALAASGDYDLVLATRDWHPADHGSFAAQGGPWPPHCVQDSEGAALHPGLDTGPIDAIVDKGQDPGTEGYSGFEATGLAERLRGAASTRSRSSGSPPTTASRTPRSTRCGRGSPCASTRPRCGAWRSRRATPNGRSRSCGPPVRPWRSRPRARARRSACSRSCARTSTTRACSPRSRGAARPLRPRAPARRGVGQRRAADRLAGRRSPSRSWSRACASCWSCAATSGCSTSAPAPATTRPCSRGSSRTSGAIELHPGLARARRAALAATGVDNVTLARRRRLARAPGGAPYDAINVAAAMRGDPARAARAARRRAAGSSGRSTTATSGSCCCAAARRRAAARGARARALRAAGQRTGVRRGLGRYSRPTFAHGRRRPARRRP